MTPYYRARARPALLRVTLDARPGGELIPGAVGVVVATVHDDGERGVDDVRLRVTVPSDVEPVDGSFTRGELAIDDRRPRGHAASTPCSTNRSRLRCSRPTRRPSRRAARRRAAA